MIQHTLTNTPKSAWPSALNKLQQAFKAPVKLLPINTLTPLAQQQLRKWQVAFTEHDGGSIATISFLAPDQQHVVVLGPLKDIVLLRYETYAFIGVALLLLFFIVWIWTYPFYRNLNKLQKLADYYGKGQCDHHVTVPKQLALYPLHQNLTRMAQQIEQLIASQKELMQAVSHEIRTPLTRIRFASEMLEQQKVDPLYLTQINQDIAELDQLIDELLTYAKFDYHGYALPLRQHNLSHFTAALIQDLQKHHANLNWVTHIQPSCQASFDTYFLKRALTNILLNATRYAKSTIQTSVTTINDQCVIDIEDDGPGIPQSEWPTIFEPFKRVEKSRNRDDGGYGLGLSIAQKIVLAHGGTISVGRSNLGGALFKIQVPRHC